MMQWLESIAGPQYVPAILWTLAALAALLVLLLVIRILRRLQSGTFVAGGRSRKTRLAVMDATAVDSHRRLILVRRDDVEHLLLIGGPTDVVVEQNIRLLAPARRPDAANQQPPRPRPPEQQQPAPPAQRQALPLHPPAASQPRPVAQPAPPRPREATAEIKHLPRPVVAAPASSARQIVPAKTPMDDIDETLLQELEVSLDDAKDKVPAAKRTEASLEDEMAKLLGELSGPRK